MVNLTSSHSWKSVAALILLAAAPCDVAAQEVGLPATAGSFLMTDSSRYDRPELGIMYTYASPEGVRANAYVYPVPEERLRSTEGLQVSQEAKSFVGTLAAGIERGWYSDVNVVVNEPRVWETRDGPRPGHVVAAVFLRENGNLVSFMHLVILGDQYVKTRLTMPAEQWQNSLAPNFGPNLFEQLTAETGAQPGA